MNRFLFSAICLAAVIIRTHASHSGNSSGSGSSSGSGMMFSCHSQELLAPEGHVEVYDGAFYGLDTFGGSGSMSLSGSGSAAMLSACPVNVTQCVSVLFLDPSKPRVSGGCYDTSADWVISQKVHCEPGDDGVYVSLDGSFIYSCCSLCNTAQMFDNEAARAIYEPDCDSPVAEECVAEYAEAYGCTVKSIQIDEPVDHERCANYVRPKVSCLWQACQDCDCGAPGPVRAGCEDLCAGENLEDIPSNGCPADKVGNGVCDLFCMTEDALFDGGDCSTEDSRLMTRSELLRLHARFDMDMNEVLSYEEAMTLTRDTRRRPISMEMFDMLDIKDKDEDKGLDWFELGLALMPSAPLDHVDRRETPRMTFMMESAMTLMKLVDANVDGAASFDEINALFRVSQDQFGMIDESNDDEKVTMIQLMKVLNVVSSGLLGRDQIDDVDVKMACMTAIGLTDYNGDGMMSMGESKLLRFSSRMFVEFDADEDGKISGMELYELVKAAGEYSCEGFRSLDMQKGEMKFVASPLRFDDSVCNILVMPEWNYEKSDAMYIEPPPMSEASLRRKKSIRPRPPTLRNREALHRITRRKNMLEKKGRNVDDVREKSSLFRKLTSLRHVNRKLLYHSASGSASGSGWPGWPGTVDPNVTYPFLVSLHTRKRICTFEHYLPKDNFCSIEPWLIYEHIPGAGPEGLKFEDMCLSMEEFTSIAKLVPDTDRPDVITEEDVKKQVYNILQRSFNYYSSTLGSGFEDLFFPGGYSEFQGVIEFFYPKGMRDLMPFPPDLAVDGTVCKGRSDLSDFWWNQLTLNGVGSGTASGSGLGGIGPCVSLDLVVSNLGRLATDGFFDGLGTFLQGYLCTKPKSGGHVGSESGSGSGSGSGSMSGSVALDANGREDPEHLDFGDSYHYCSGTLIDKKWVLTAASCVEDVESVVKYDTVKVGGMNVQSGKSIRISRVLVHPGFRTVDHMMNPISEFDAALIELEEPVEDLLPIRLYDGKDLGYSDCHQLMLNALGFPPWGDRSGADLEWQYNYECDEEKEEELGYKGAVTPAMLCTINDDDEEDMPVMDIGGPLVAKPSDLIKDVPLTLVGVLSSKESQRNIYTRVTAIRQWVLATIGRHPMKELSVTFSDLSLPNGTHFWVRSENSHTAPCPRERCYVQECDIEAGVWKDEGKGAMVLTLEVDDGAKESKWSLQGSNWAEKRVQWSFEASLDIDGCGLNYVESHHSKDREHNEEPECKKCVLDQIRWEDVTEMARMGKSFTGGLGAKAVHTFHQVFGVWVCLRDWDVEEQLACGAKPSQIVCFRFNEKEEARSFDFYGLNDALLLVKEDQIEDAIMKELKGISTLQDPPRSH